jgi:hypothetical protein
MRQRSRIAGSGAVRSAGFPAPNGERIPGRRAAFRGFYVELPEI